MDAFGKHGLEKFLDGLRAVIDEGERAALRAGQVGGQVQTKGMVNGGDDFGWAHRAFGRVSADFIALADDAAAFDAAARENTWSSIAASGPRPPAGFTLGVRPNSARLQTMVLSRDHVDAGLRSKRCSPGHTWGATMSFMPAMEVKGF